MLTRYFSNIKFESKFWDNPPKRKRSGKESRTEWLTDRQWDSDKVYSLSPYFRFNRLKFMSGHINFSSWNYYIEILMKGLILLSFDLSGGDRLHQITGARLSDEEQIIKNCTIRQPSPCVSKQSHNECDSTKDLHVFMQQIYDIVYMNRKKIDFQWLALQKLNQIL